jgi:8-oxo-dGTP diphosphatase
MKFCRDCGAELVGPAATGSGPTCRFCPGCKQPCHDHPSVMLTCFVSCGDKLLWMQRGLNPRAGFWAIPGGFMEAGEGLAQGAARELREETGVCIPPERLQFYMTGTITFINQVYVAFRATVDAPTCSPGPEALAATFYSRSECPWGEVAYPEVNDSIRRAYDDLERGEFGLYHAQMTEDLYSFEPIVTS